MERTENNEDLFHLKRLFGEGIVEDDFQQRINDFFPAIVYVYDADQQKLRYINKKVTDVLGYTYEDITTWNNGILQLVFEEDQERVKEEIQKFYDLEDNSSHLYECRLNDKQGDWRYFRTRGTVLRRNEHGKAGSLLFIAEDITEQFKSSEEIKQLKQLQLETENLLGFGVYNYDLATGNVGWSDGIYQILEYEKEKDAPIITFDVYLAHVPDTDRQMLKTVIEKSIEAKSVFTVTYPVITNKGNRKVISTRGKLVVADDGTVQKVVGSMLDITQEVARQEALEEYQQNMIQKEQFLDFGSWEEDVNKGVMLWSEGMYRLFGYDPKEYAGRLVINPGLYMLHLQHDDWLRSNLLRQEAIKHKNDYSYEVTITTRDGINKRLQTFARVIRNDDNEVVRIIGTSRDITQLRSYERNLESIVNDLNRSNKDLEEFAYIASHDLQEPLRKLSTFSERLVTRHSSEMGPEGKRYAERILAATDNMRILIENLLEFSRTARSSIPFGRVDLNTVLDQAISDLEIIIEKTGAMINSDRLPVIDAIPSQIQQLFSNLIGNALKFRKEDVVPRVDIKVEVLSNTEKTEHGFAEDINYYRIEVRDNCIGFEQEYAGKIFQIFQRLHGKVEYPGSGVGLAICKKIAENHRGIIFANSKPGEGSVFTIILPEKH
ncbi:MAG: PAS domain S-box protein [Chitinophagaceae bacterium]|nr:MAG: PAS domain S-box protein [Chitinophagaceae bacterium]